MTYKPVVVDKAARALSIETIEVPGKDGTFIQVFSNDDEPVLVPVTSLEAMRNLVNLKMRQREDSVLTRTPDTTSEKKELKRYVDKLEGLVQKLDQSIEYDDDEEFDKKYSSIENSETIHKIADQRLNQFIANEQLEKTRKLKQEVDVKSKQKETDGEASSTNKINSAESMPLKDLTDSKSGSQLTEETISSSQALKNFVRKKALQLTKKDKSVTKTIDNQPDDRLYHDQSVQEKVSIIEEPAKETETQLPLDGPNITSLPPKEESQSTSQKEETEIMKSRKKHKVHFIPRVKKQSNGKKSVDFTGQSLNTPQKESSNKKHFAKFRKRIVTASLKRENIQASPIQMPKTRTIELPTQDRSLTEVSCSQAFKDLVRKKTGKMKMNRRDEYSPNTNTLEVQPVNKSDPYISSAKKEIEFVKPIKMAEKFVKTRGPEKPFPEDVDTPSLKNKSEYRTVRFFIYGHIKNNKQPEFLLQPYKGDSLLGGKTSHRDSKNSDDGIDVLISGKFYPKNILEEENERPVRLTVGNRKIKIGNESIIFKGGATDALSTDELLIVVKGTFIKNSNSFYTPSLFIGVERNVDYKYKPRSANCPVKKRLSRKEAFFKRSKIPTYIIESSGFELFPTRTEGGETIYEASPIRRQKTPGICEKLTSDEEQGVYESHPRKHVETSNFPENSRVYERKIVFGDEEEDFNRFEKVDTHSVNKKETIVYECGKYYKSKSDVALVTNLSLVQSKTEYGDTNINHAKSSQEMSNKGNVICKAKHRKTDLLRRLNNMIFCK